MKTNTVPYVPTSRILDEAEAVCAERNWFAHDPELRVRVATLMALNLQNRHLMDIKDALDGIRGNLASEQ